MFSEPRIFSLFSLSPLLTTRLFSQPASSHNPPLLTTRLFSQPASSGLRYATQPILSSSLTMIYHEFTLSMYRICFKASNFTHSRITLCSLTFGSCFFCFFSLRGNIHPFLAQYLWGSRIGFFPR